jgi:16S rRNA processing protein RimM
MIEPAAASPRAMIEYIAKAIVEAKGEVFIDEYEDGDETVIELEVAEADLGKIIGRSGRVARALRNVLTRGRLEAGEALRARDHRVIGQPERVSEWQRIAMADASGEWITLAVVIKTQGRRGEVAVELHTDVPDRFRQGMRLSALQKDGQRREVTIEDLWPHKSYLVLKFQGIETISDAEPLVGAELQLPSSERADLEQGWTYLSDLIGCTVFDGQREIGQIEDVQFGAGEAPLLVVRGEAQKGEAAL